MDRSLMIQQLEKHPEWDICIIGGGATGLGIAVDAASRGLKTILFERADLAQGTSSRSTKLIHGGVRYLRQGNISLVKDALRERGLLLKNAAHVVHDLPFVIPAYRWWEKPFYGLGLKLYDLMAGKSGLGKASLVPRQRVHEILPTVNDKGLRGGILYHDGQFDDSRLAICLAQTAANFDAVILNYFPVNGFIKRNGKTAGLKTNDAVTGKEYEINARVVINATGVFVDEVLAMDSDDHEPLLQPSQGIHIVVDKNYLPGNTAMMIPRTSDGRVLFALPWHGKVLIGTTDSPVKNVSAEPLPMREEIEFLLQDISRYLEEPPSIQDIKSIFVGLRPLIKGKQKNTAALSRDHFMTTSESGLITITGGKWTSYRKMAEDAVNFAITRGGLPDAACRTKTLTITGSNKNPVPAGIEDLSEDEIRSWIRRAVQEELCMTVEDFLSRRTRQLILDAQKAMDLAPIVADCLREELKRDEEWERQQVHNFRELARKHLPAYYYQH